MDRQVQKPPGPSAFRWGLRGRSILRMWVIPALILSIVAGGVRLIVGARFLPYVFIPLALFFAGMLCVIVCLLASLLKTEMERRAGYTTLSTQGTDVAQVAPDTDVVIREPGEPPLGVLEYKAAIDRAQGHRS